MADLNVSLPRLAQDFVEVGQAGQALQNKLEELNNKALEYIKANNPTLLSEIEQTEAAIKRIDDTYEQVGIHLNRWSGADEK